MIDTFTLTSSTQQAEWLRAPAGGSRRRFSLAILRSIIASWEERKRFRLGLEQMANDNPHLIDDIGLTRRQVETEIAKRFWQE